MLYKSQFWLLTILAALAAVFSIANMVLHPSNRSMQIEVSGGQQYIQQTIQLQVLYNEMVRAIADLAVKHKDPELVTLLSAQGIGIAGTPPGSPAAAPTEGAK